MKKEEIFKVISNELDFQDRMKKFDESHVREGLTTGEFILAIDKLLIESKAIWYGDSPPHEGVRHNLRKIAALCVAACIEDGMPERL